MLRRSAIASLAIAAALHAPGAGAQTTLTEASACMNKATWLQQQLETRVTGPVERRDAIRLLWRARDHAETGDVSACEQAIADASARLEGAEPGPGRAGRQDTAVSSAEIPAQARPDSTRGIAQFPGENPSGPAAAPGNRNPVLAVGSLIRNAGLKTVEGAAVANENGEPIGEVTRVVQRPDGAEILLVVGVGGFLGLGSREVALPLSDFRPGDQALVLSNHDRQSLGEHPAYDSDRYTEIGMGAMGGSQD